MKSYIQVTAKSAIDPVLYAQNDICTKKKQKKKKRS